MSTADTYPRTVYFIVAPTMRKCQKKMPNVAEHLVNMIKIDSKIRKGRIIDITFKE